MTNANDTQKADGATKAADKKADLIGVAVIFMMLTLGAIYFVSGWTFDLG